ncbi:MAG: DNA ligase D [Candidatus Dormibacteria bacterium]
MKRRVRAETGPQAKLKAPRLAPYQSKRDLERSPEPDGLGRGTGHTGRWGQLPKGHRFCVQLHRASRLHYDLRLEHRGALLSWAVPKGPSMEPGLRRLAVQVEDHPLEYGDFEDVIPSGYGAGTVLIWDMGRLDFDSGPKGDVVRGLELGHLDFRLRGERLRGAFSLVRMDRGSKGDKPSWLLFKRRDPEPEPQGPTQPGPEVTSVKTGRTLDQVAQGAPPQPKHRAPRRRPGPDLGGLLRDAPEAKPPSSLKPMLATLVDSPFSAPGWIYELKYDGVRCLLRREGRSLRLQGRSGRDETGRYPELQEAVGEIGSSDCLIDGEVVALDQEGTPSFARLQRRIQQIGERARAAARAQPVTFMAFDLLFAEGRDLRRLPLAVRKQALRRIVGPGQRIRYADEVDTEGEALFAKVRELGLEGVMAKRTSSIYASGRRSRDWLKIKARQSQDCVVCGFQPGQGRRRELGALLLGVYQEGKLVFAGKVGTGFAEALLQDLRRRLERIRQVGPPFATPASAARNTVFTRPELVCEVEHAGWTGGGRLRQPSFKTLRPDVPPGACIRASEVPRQEAVAPPGPRGEDATSVSDPPPAAREEPQALAELARLPARGGTLKVGRRQLRLTHLDKVLWPEGGIRKRDLIAYHLRMAPWLLPHLKGRAVVTQVFPDGVGRPGFWRRALPRGAPPWIRTWRAHPGEPTICPLIEEAAGLVWLANLGAIEVHPWHSRRDRPTQPDWAVFDLDPGPDAGWEEAVEVAKLVKGALDQLQMVGHLKTTGQTGLHIFVPLRRGPDQAEVRDWVGQLSHVIAQTAPELVTETWAVKGRRGKVRIDFTQNVVGKTLAAVYSPRPGPGGPISTPIAWDELERVDPRQFTLATVPARVGRRGDLFQPVLQQHQRLPRLAPPTSAGVRRRGAPRRK